MSDPIICACGGNHALDWDTAAKFANGDGQLLACMGDAINRVMAGEQPTPLDRRLFVTLMLRTIQQNYLQSAIEEVVFASMPVKGGAN